MAEDRSTIVLLQHSIAKLTSIDLSLLVDECPREAKRLLDSGQSDGFFYLDLGNHHWEDYSSLAGELLSSARAYFEKPLKEKLLYRHTDEKVAQTAGYKPVATETGVCDNTKDGFEAYKVPSNSLFGHRDVGATRTSEGCFHDEKDLKTFATQSHHISNIIMASLWRSLDMDCLSNFPDYHQIESSSSSAVVVNYYPTQTLPDGSSIGHNAHTDMGSITLLFCSTWGLQVCSSDCSTWSYVPPMAGKAIVNIGDTLRFLSGNMLRSSLHRVINHPEWMSASRLSLAYFTRPNATTNFVDFEGTQWHVEDWIARKFRSYQESHAKQREDWVQVGKKGLIGSVTSAPYDEADRNRKDRAG